MAKYIPAGHYINFSCGLLKYISAQCTELLFKNLHPPVDRTDQPS